MKGLIWSARAQRNLLDIANYYDQQGPSLAAEIIGKIQSAPEILLDFPKLGAPAWDGTRKWRVRGTPFLLFYDCGGDDIEIVTVRHVRSDIRR